MTTESVYDPPRRSKVPTDSPRGSRTRVLRERERERLVDFSDVVERSFASREIERRSPPAAALGGNPPNSSEGDRVVDVSPSVLAPYSLSVNHGAHHRVKLIETLAFTRSILRFLPSTLCGRLLLRRSQRDTQRIFEIEWHGFEISMFFLSSYIPLFCVPNCRLHKSFDDNPANSVRLLFTISLCIFYITSFLTLRSHVNVLKRLTLRMVSTKLFLRVHYVASPLKCVL